MLITITGPVLDSAGRPANGWLRVTASRPFDTAQGHVTQALSTASVRDGVPLIGGQPLKLPATPDGVYMTIIQDLDGDRTQRFDVVVPEADSAISYSQLLSNRGGGEGGWNPFMWDLSGGLDFPPEALVNDWGIDYTSDPTKILFFKKG